MSKTGWAPLPHQCEHVAKNSSQSERPVAEDDDVTEQRQLTTGQQYLCYLFTNVFNN